MITRRLDGTDLLDVAYLILLLLHFSQEKLRINVALLKKVLQPLVAHLMRVPLPRLSCLMVMVMVNKKKNKPKTRQELVVIKASFKNIKQVF